MKLSTLTPRRRRRLYRTAQAVVRGKHADRIEDAMKKARRAANKTDRPGKAARWRELLAVLREKFPKKESK